MANRSKGLTVKETKFIEGVAQGKKKRDAARDAGYNGNDATVSVIASHILAKPTVQEALEKALIKHGITVEDAVAPIADALKAEKVHIVGNGEQAMADIVPDHSVRLKAASMALDLMGAKKSEGGGVNINFIQQVQQKKEQYDL